MLNITRRDMLSMSLTTTAALWLGGRDALAQGKMLTRAIPSTGEPLPVIGLGSSATFSQVASQEDVSALRTVFRTLLDGGATLFDTAPSYGASEEAAGRIAREDKFADRLFWATKLNVAGRDGGPADPAAARAQVEQSFERLGRAKIDLVQVHNLGDTATQLPILREYKEQGRIRYVGVTTTFDPQYVELLRIMRTEPLDFIGVDYAIDGREVEQEILPLAQERRIAVLVYAPFGRTRLFRRVANRPLPDWAAEIDARSWAQVFLKWIIGHPAITAVTPATSQAKHMLDNIGGGIGRLPSEELRREMAAFVDALPAA